MKKLIAGLFAVAAFTFSVSAQNQDNDRRLGERNHPGLHKGHDQQEMRDMKDLNLTEAQRQQIKAINFCVASLSGLVKSAASIGLYSIIFTR